MTDVALPGSSVRDASGRRGEILSIDPSFMVVGWWDTGSPGVQEEDLAPEDERCAQIEVLTLSAGWVPVGNFVEASEVEEEGPRGLTLAEDLQNLLIEKKHSPFKRAAKTGPAIGSKITRKRNYWSCEKGKHGGYKPRSGGGNKNYQACTGKEGEKKTVSRDKSKKAAYQKLYKRFWKDRQGVAAPTLVLKKRMKREARAKAKK